MLGRLGARTVCLLNAVLFSVAMASEEGSWAQHLTPVQWYLVVAGGVCVVLLTIYILFVCTDCYKSEVSTECHPATSSGGPKWGGAGGYSAAATSDVNGSMLGAGFVGEEVIPLQEGVNQPLPYAMIPSGVPEAQGFRGYGPVEPAGGGGDGGYGSTGAHQPSVPVYGGGSSLAGYGGGNSSLGGYGGGNSSLGGYGGGNSSLGGYGGGNSSLGGYGGGNSSLAGYGASSSVVGYGGTSSVVGYGGGSSSLAGYSRGGGAPSGISSAPTLQPGQGGYPGGGHRSSRPLPGAHLPLMTSDPEEPPPSYFAAAHQR